MEESETETQKESQEQPPQQGPEDRSEPQTTSVIDSANKAAERLEAQNKRFEENIARMEQLRAYERLGGKSNAGKPSEPDTKSQAEEEAKRALKRFGFNN